MCANGVNSAVVHNNDHIRILNGCNSLCNDDLGGICQLISECLADLCFGGCINRAGGVIKNEYLRLFKQSTGDAKTLFLSARNVGTALGYHRVIAILEGGNELICLCALGCICNLFVAGFFITPAQVIAYRSREEGVVLQYHTDALAQVIKGIILDIYAVNQNLALVGIVKTGNKRNECCLSAACRADDTDNALRGDGQVDVFQNSVGAVLVISEGNVLKFNIAVADGHFGMCTIFIVDVDLFVQNFADTLSGCHCTGSVHKQEGNHHQREEDL